MTTNLGVNDDDLEQPKSGSIPGNGVQGASPGEGFEERESGLRGGELEGGGAGAPVLDGEISEADEQRTGQYIQISHSGPLPHPEILTAYGRAGSDFPERIVKMAESELEARLAIAKKLSSADAFATIVGMSGFLLLTAAGIAGAFIGGVLMENPQAYWFLTLPAVSGLPKVIAALKGRSVDE